MKGRIFLALLLALAVPPALSAQTRGRAGSSTRPAGKAEQKPTPATPRTGQPSAAGSQQASPAVGPAAPVTAVATDACGCEGGPLPAVLAVVGGVEITPGDLSEQVRNQVGQLREQVVEARRDELDEQVNDLLFDAEAKKRGVGKEKLLEDEVLSKTVNPTEAEARAFYERNRERIGGDFDAVRPQVISYLREQRRQDRARKFAESLRAAHGVKILVPEPPPPADESDRARVLATVDGRSVTSGDVEDALLPLVAEVQEQVYALRRQDLERKINELLITQEARRRQVEPRELIEEEVGSKTRVVGEAQALEFYNENKERIGGEFAEVKYQIIQYLEDRQRQQLEEELAGRIRQASEVRTFLVAPEPPTFRIATDGQPSKGSPSAAVTVVEFTDYQCPSCAAAQPVLERLVEEMGGRVRLVVRDFPLAQHENAFKAAEAAEAAREQGKYWEYVSVLFRNQSSLGVERLKQYASALGLDRAKFDAALDSGKFAGEVWRDLQEGTKLGVNATPTVFVNGRRVKDVSYEGIKAAVEAALAAEVRK